MKYYLDAIIREFLPVVFLSGILLVLGPKNSTFFHRSSINKIEVLNFKIFMLEDEISN